MSDPLIFLIAASQVHDPRHLDYHARLEALDPSDSETAKIIARHFELSNRPLRAFYGRLDLGGSGSVFVADFELVGVPR